jgi:hypothetical protein
MRVLITASTRLTMMDWGPRSRTSNELSRSAACVGVIDRGHSLRWALPRSQCAFRGRSRTPEPALTAERWFLSVCYPYASVCELKRLLFDEMIILFSKLTLLQEGLFPPPLQLAGDQPVLGIDRLIPVLCVFGFVPCAPEPLLPQGMESSPFGLQVGHRGEAQLHRDRLQDLQHQRRD